MRAGDNPYRFAPDSETLASYRDQSVWPYIDHKAVSAIYPPLAQYIFALLPAEIWKFRLVSSFVDSCFLLVLLWGLRARGHPSSLVLLYAWNPLPLIEISWSPAFRSLFTPLMYGAVLLALRSGSGGIHRYFASLLFAAAFLVKFVAIIPGGIWGLSWYKREKRVTRVMYICTGIATLGCFIAYLPFLAYPSWLLQGMSTYAANWRFNVWFFRF